MLPQLIEEDIQKMDSLLQELVTNSEATTALILDKGGFLITQQGDSSQFDVTTLSALAAASFAATQGIAGLVKESNFNSVYQQGENFSMLAANISDDSLLVVIFPSTIGVGAIKYYAASTIEKVAEQLKIAQERAPGQGIDLSALNLSDPSAIFRKKDS